MIPEEKFYVGPTKAQEKHAKYQYYTKQMMAKSKYKGKFARKVIRKSIRKLIEKGQI
jgi:hypothetical protein